MSKDKGRRKVEKKVGDQWLLSAIQFLRKGDTFRLFEGFSKDSEKVLDDKGNDVFLADSDAYKNENDVWVIDVLK